MTDESKLPPSTSGTGRRPKPTWRETLERHAPVMLPAAHDGLTARMIEQAGFVAYQIGGFAYAGAHFGYPDIDLIHYGETPPADRRRPELRVLRGRAWASGMAGD